MSAAPSYRVLVADDDPGCRESLVSLLVQEGFLAVAVEGGQQAIRLIRERGKRRLGPGGGSLRAPSSAGGAELPRRSEGARLRGERRGSEGTRDGQDGSAEKRAVDLGFDFLVLDYELRDVTGLDVLRSLREEPVTLLPSILVTGSFSRELERAACALGGFAVLSKPVEPTRFRSLVWHLVRTHYDGPHLPPAGRERTNR